MLGAAEDAVCTGSARALGGVSLAWNVAKTTLWKQVSAFRERS